YTERITAMATQVRSLYFALLMAAQDAERMEGTAGGNSVSTLMQNAGVKISGKIVSDEKTMNILRRAAGQEAHARMETLKRKDGLLGTDWQDGDQTRIVDEDKLKLKDLINLQAGENVTIFNGHPVAGTSMYIPDSEKTSGTPVQINRLIQVDPIPLAELRHLVPRESERRIPRPEKVSRLIGILKGEVESPVDSFTLISPMMCRLHDECARQVLD
ncbi:TrbC protein, partial [Escherichia coli]